MDNVNTHEDVLKQIYSSDIILSEMEREMMKNVDDRFLSIMDELYQRIDQQELSLSKQEFETLESAFHQFYFDYGFVQFKRGLELGLILRDIH